MIENRGIVVKSIALLSLCVLSAGAVLAQSPIVAGVVNGASFAQGQPVAPGSIVSIFGSNLASSLATASTIPLSTTINSVSVTFNNTPAPLYFVSPGQVNAQVPGSISSTASVVVTTNGLASAPAAAPVGPWSPPRFILGTG